MGNHEDLQEIFQGRVGIIKQKTKKYTLKESIVYRCKL
jgi:hypothetical protein